MEEIKKAEAQIRLFQSIIHHMEECVIITEPDPIPSTPWRRITFVNQAFCQMTGYAASEIVGQTAECLLGNNPSEEVVQKLAHAIDQKQAIEGIELQQYKKSGESYWTDFSIFPIVEETGSLSAWYVIQRDITEKKRAQALLLQSKEQLESILESITDAFFAVDNSWNFTYVNNEFERLMGVERASILGQHLWTHFPEAKTRKFYFECQKAMEEQISVKFTEYYPPLKAWYRVSAYPKKEELTVYFQEVTQEKNLEMEMEKSEQNLLSLINNTKAIIWSVDKDLKLICSNRAFVEAIKMQIGRDIQKGDEVFRFSLEEEKRERWRMYYQLALNGKHFRVVDCELNQQGEECYVETSFNPVFGKETIVGVSCVAHDITEKKNAELQLIRSSLAGEDRERKRIAKELHDGLGQNLTAALFNLSATEGYLAGLDSRKHQQLLTGLNFLNTALEESRRIAYNLMPKALEDFGLALSLKSLVGDIQKHSSLTVVFYTNLKNKRFSQQLELNLYRIAQELLQNPLKHAQATKISLQLIEHREELSFTYEDDGKGFAIQNPPLMQQGLGLRNISNRVTVLKGQLHIDSQLGKGMAITIAVPIDYEE